MSFRASACPATANRGVASISASSGNVEVTGIIKPNGKPLAVEVAIQPGATLKLSVSFSDPVDFPCNVDWRNAHLVAMTDTNIQSQPASRDN